MAERTNNQTYYIMENTNVTALKEQLMAKLPPLRPLEMAVLEECCEGIATAQKSTATVASATVNYHLLLNLMSTLLTATFNAHGEGSLNLNYRGQTYHPTAQDLHSINQLIQQLGQEIQ